MKKKYSPLAKTLFLAVGAASLSAYAAYVLQSQSEKKILVSCSYLDSISVDILAFVIGAFLIAEGLSAIISNRHSPVYCQLTRCTRICIGASIFVIHIMQFLHK